MKDINTIWSRILGRTYDAVGTDRRDDCPENSPAQVALRAINGKYKCAITIAFIGLVGMILGLSIVFLHPYEHLYKWKSTFGEGGEIFDLWRVPPVELYLKVYLWNVTNKEAYMNGIDDKLKIVDVGPYVYRENMEHKNITFHPNGTLSTVPQHPLVWVPELSEGRSEDDMLILPNIALLSIAHVVSDESYFTKLGLNMLIRQTKSEPLVEMTAKEFMFGYSSALMTLGNQFMPNWIYFDKLGLIDRMYDFDGDFETIYTGDTEFKHIGLIDTYRGSTKIPQWESPCGDIQGASDGTKFPGDIQPNDTLLFFRKSMCRAKNLVRINETVEHNGLKAYVYEFDPDADDNGRVNENNKCFCNNKDKCLPKGLLDVHGCYYGFPIALSYPHFLDGDKSLSANVEGVNPDPAKHKSYFHVEPSAGLPLQLAVRYQINMALGSIKTIANTEKFADMVLPLLWTEIGMYGLPDSLAARFILYLNVGPVLEEAAKYFFLIMGAIFLLYSLRRFVYLRTNKNFDSPWLEDQMIHNIERKLSNYIPEKRASMTAKELEIYISSLVTPLNQEITFQEFQDMKEVDL